MEGVDLRENFVLSALQHQGFSTLENTGWVVIASSVGDLCLNGAIQTVVIMRQVCKDQKKVSVQTSCPRKYNQYCDGFLFWLLYWLYESDIFLKNLIHSSGKFLLALINLFFPSCIPLLLADGNFGKLAWWVVNNQNSKPSIFYFQKAEYALRLSSLQLPDLGEISLRTALTGSPGASFGTH